ncbi:splicing factor 3A subunit 3 [Fonsecaea monophora]|uniref:Splicing factor 3A subunit 3 n=1 Tax=Fonsecaea monophora TaxID=254056 RepID=A0A177EZ23_9EURO|nr:splicing factor 3A subunit 3 [Fonsecaea monophora]OAG36189.1 splicing factor 3A subunit 3 [Fonsecaea monophora]
MNPWDLSEKSQLRQPQILKRLVPLLTEGKITYDLLWALFKANDHVISDCSGSGKPRCFRYGMGEEKKTEQGVEYFELQCQYLDFDGEVFGAVLTKLAIEKFRGARQIYTLNAYPLEFHPGRENMRKRLRKFSRDFVGLMGIRYRYYNGYAFL